MMSNCKSRMAAGQASRLVCDTPRLVCDTPTSPQGRACLPGGGGAGCKILQTIGPLGREGE